MSFLYPYFLSFIIPVSLLYFFIKRADLNKIPFNQKILISNNSVKLNLIPLILILLIISLARPVIYKKSSNKFFAQTLFIALDISASMKAKDISPSRFEKAKEEIKDIIKKSKFKIGLIVFTSNPLIIAPPTSDKKVLIKAIESINPNYILTKSTDIQRLLDFVSKFGRKINLAIFSDGGDFKEIKKPKNVKIFAVKMATKKGALIPVGDGFLKRGGKLVVTKLNQNFEKIADKSFEYDEYLDILNSLDEKKSLVEKKERLELFFIPLLLALILFLEAFTFVFERLKKFFPFLLLVFYINLKGDILDEIFIKEAYSAYEKGDFKKSASLFKKLSYFEARYGYALSLMQMGDYKKALEVFLSLKSKNPKIKAEIYYNIGICYEKMRNYGRALEFFAKSAALFKKEDTLKHIEKLVFKKSDKKPPPPFSKRKTIKAKNSSKKDSKKIKKGGSSNMQEAALSSNFKGGKKNQKQIVTKKGGFIPFGSKLYEMINRGYINEKNPW